MSALKSIIDKSIKPAIYSLPPKLLNNLPIGLPEKALQWSIGIYKGQSPFDLTAAENIKNPVISRSDVSDVRAGFVADPFMIKVEQTWYMFFEVFNNETLRGEIGLATSHDAIAWKYEKIILAEPFHLSYPYVFEWMGEYYMIPESFEAQSIRLYKAKCFPRDWEFVGNIMSGGVFLDASLIHHDNKWWLFTETNPEHKYDTLRLFFADELLGEWSEHPASPIIQGNGHIARPGGRVIMADNKIIRYTQDCDPEYGMQVRAFAIHELSTTAYHEQEIFQNPVLVPSGKGWNGSGMHHIDPHQINEREWIACVDGRVFIDR